MKLDLAIRELHRSERKLARDLYTMAARHKTDHEIWYTAHDIALWSEEHVKLLAEAGRGYGLNLKESPRTEPITAGMQEKVAEVIGRRPEPGLLLLLDLRHVHRVAAGVSLDWELLAQAAQSAKHVDLLELSQRCHPETLRQQRWANAMLKVLSPQILTT
ncbi:hypothetical protein FOS14_11830 [Skermania sp. ID1734]|uniref:hypothetical protein n=1 Tax=Skermania sp. ID1734 TaxID=2597516 RepID=UPI00117E67C0|nr:hypothetical protein [Skermania sp. ID1734]TSD99470.1 hypothetical protein FOS14_11830 [Skermania sp. ID1734]